MKLLTKEIKNKLPKLYETDSQGDSAIAQVKFFTPWTKWTWYAVEYNPDCRLFYGLVDGLERELGYWGLEELEDAVGPGGLKIERDRYFNPTALRNL